MKKVFSLVAIALIAVSVLFTACRDNASQGTETQETAPATEQPAAAPADTTQQAAPADTTQQAQ
jgi:predicted small secreted protein